jgi:hypothetical protein
MCLRVLSIAEVHVVTNRSETLKPHETLKTFKKAKQFVTNEIFVKLPSVFSVPAPPKCDLTYLVASLSHPPFMWVW